MTVIKKPGRTGKWNPRFANKAGEPRENPRHRQDSMEIVMKKKLNFQEKIIYVQEVDIFKHLTVSELAAISDLADEITIDPGEILFHEKTLAGTMYICVEGELIGSRNNVEAGRFRSGDSFGKNAFLVDSTHFLTCRAKTRTRLLEIHRQEFEEILMVYPQVSCEIAKTHAGIIQWLLDQIKEGKNHECLMKIFFNKGYC